MLSAETALVSFLTRHMLFIVFDFGPQDFKRDRSFQLAIFGEIDLTHPAGADLLENAIDG